MTTSPVSLPADLHAASERVLPLLDNPYDLLELYRACEQEHMLALYEWVKDHPHAYARGVVYGFQREK